MLRLQYRCCKPHDLNRGPHAPSPPLYLLVSLRANRLVPSLIHLQFVVYENLRARAIANDAAAVAAAGGVSSPALPAPPSGSSVFAAAAVAKFIACVTTYPHEVLRTRLREQNSSECAAAQSSSITAAHLARRYYRGIVHCTKTIIREEGFRGLYSGVGAHLVRVVPNSAIMFLVYEAVVNSSLWGNET